MNAEESLGAGALSPDSPENVLRTVKKQKSKAQRGELKGTHREGHTKEVVEYEVSATSEQHAQ